MFVFASIPTLIQHLFSASGFWQAYYPIQRSERLSTIWSTTPPVLHSVPRHPIISNIIHSDFAYTGPSTKVRWRLADVYRRSHTGTLDLGHIGIDMHAQSNLLGIHVHYQHTRRWLGWIGLGAYAGSTTLACIVSLVGLDSCVVLAVG